MFINKNDTSLLEMLSKMLKIQTINLALLSYHLQTINSVCFSQVSLNWVWKNPFMFVSYHKPRFLIFKEKSWFVALKKYSQRSQIFPKKYFCTNFCSKMLNSKNKEYLTEICGYTKKVLQKIYTHLSFN